MFDTGYPSRLSVLAARVDDLTAEVAARHHRLAAATATGSWDGPAARAFRRNAGELLAGLHRTATLLEHAADALRLHGRALVHEAGG